MKKRKQSNNDESHPPSTLCTVYFVFLCIFGQYTKFMSLRLWKMSANITILN